MNLLEPQTCWREKKKKKTSHKFLHLHSRDMHAIKTVGFVAITEENTHEGGWVMSDSTCVDCLELVSTCAGVFRDDSTGVPGEVGLPHSFLQGLERITGTTFGGGAAVVRRGGYGGQTLPIWFQFGVDLISLSDGSNQGVSTVIPLQRGKKKKPRSGDDAGHKCGTHSPVHTHHPLKQRSVERHRGRQPSCDEYLCRSCHLLFKLRLCRSIFLHEWLVGLCSFFGFHSSLRDVNRQMNDYHQCALCTHTHTIGHCFPRSTEESAKEKKKVLFNLSGQESFGL